MNDRPGEQRGDSADVPGPLDRPLGDGGDRPGASLSAPSLAVESRRTALDLVSQVRDDRGSVVATLTADIRPDGGVRVRSFDVREGREAEAASRLLTEVQRQAGDSPLSFRWRAERGGQDEPGSVNLLRAGTGDSFWQGQGLEGPAGHFQREDAAARASFEEHARQQVESLGGVDARSAPVEWMGDADFDEFVAQMDTEPSEVLGVYTPGDGKIRVRDTDESRRLGTLVHEVTHSAQPEEARDRIPAPLNEGITELISRRLDPAVERSPEVSVLPDGRVLLSRADVSSPVDGPRVVVVPETSIYGERMGAMRMLEARVGTQAVTDYWRTGDPSAIRASLTEQLGRTAWMDFRSAASDEDWPRAERILAGRD